MESDRVPLTGETAAAYLGFMFDMRLGFSEAAVIACAETKAGRVLTVDRRHFDVVAREGTITVHPEA
jgi:hypothetical protein